MKKKLILAMASVLMASLFVLAGCGGSGGATGNGSAANDLLIESAKAISNVDSYRMNAKMQIDSYQSGDSQPLSMTVDIQGEVQRSGGDTREHMVMSMGNARQESYGMGPDSYMYSTDSGWVHMNMSDYRTQNAGLGMMDIQKLGLMSQMAQDVRVFEETPEKIGISFHLGDDFFKASLQSGGKDVSEEWLNAVDQYLTGLGADMRMWLWKDSMLVDHVDLQSDSSGIRTSIQFNIFDYNQGLEITLPEEAKGARELPNSSSGN